MKEAVDFVKLFEWVREIIEGHAESTAEDFPGAVWVELHTFMSGTTSADDITLVIIKLDGL